MFTINEDRSIYVTRGDVVFFSVSAEENGKTYKFQPGDVVRIKVTEKKACENVVLEKAYRIESETDTVSIYLTADETRIGEVISKPVDYWYEIELNPFTNPQTIIGYDDNGPKIFKLFPEGGNTTPEAGEGDVSGDGNEITLYGELTKIRSELEDIRKGYDGTVYSTAGEAVRKQIESIKDFADTNITATNRNLLYQTQRIDMMNDNINELKDIRKGYDGTVYSTAGEAVRTQIGSMDALINGTTVTEEYSGGWESGKIDETSGLVVSGYYMVSDFISLPKGSVITVTELFENTRFNIYSYNVDNQEYIGLADTLYNIGDTYTAAEDILVRCMPTIDGTTRMNITTVIPGIKNSIGELGGKIKELEEKYVGKQLFVGQNPEAILSESAYNYKYLFVTYMVTYDNTYVEKTAVLSVENLYNYTNETIDGLICFNGGTGISVLAYKSDIFYDDYTKKLTSNTMKNKINTTNHEYDSSIEETDTIYFLEVYGTMKRN